MMDAMPVKVARRKLLNINCPRLTGLAVGCLIMSAYAVSDKPPCRGLSRSSVGREISRGSNDMLTTHRIGYKTVAATNTRNNWLNNCSPNDIPRSPDFVIRRTVKISRIREASVEEFPRLCIVTLRGARDSIGDQSQCKQNKENIYTESRGDAVETLFVHETVGDGQ